MSFLRVITAIAFLATGCVREDGDKLLRVAKVAADKVRDVAPQKTPLDELSTKSLTTLESRIETRLRDDKYLAGRSIVVTIVDGAVVLKGRVPSAEHKTRASELAGSTVGVSEVRNEIEVVE
jgi:osmotically-inducible protein OsmY